MNGAWFAVGWASGVVLIVIAAQLMRIADALERMVPPLPGLGG